MTDLKITSADAGWRLAHSYAQLPQIFHLAAEPVAVSEPRLVMLNGALASSLGLNAEVLANHAEWFTGNRLIPGAQPIAQAYAGHQFGHFTKLGDGRAILLGEQITPQGERFDVQLKGPGRTPFSRGGDGRAALGPMLREYLISEAMHALGIPTTRSLAVTITGETVFRQGHLRGAILTRVASSHIRVGTFQWAAATGDQSALKALADHTIQRHDAALLEAEKPYLSFLEAVIERQAALIAKWQLVGFIHGVMNTDNMALSGETIDYGPCAFMDSYDPATVFSSIDRNGRYAYGNQPHIAQWNLARLAEAMLPLLHDEEAQAIALANESIHRFQELYQKHWLTGMRSKLGLFDEEENDEFMIQSLLAWMQKTRADFTNTFRALSSESLNDSDHFGDVEFQAWHSEWNLRRTRQTQSLTESAELMRAHNPAVIPRNHKVEEALEAASDKDDFSVIQRLLKVLESPYDRTLDQPEYQTPADSDAPAYQTFCGT